MTPLRLRGEEFDPWVWRTEDTVSRREGFVVVSVGGYFDHFEDDGQTDEEFREGFRVLLAKWVLEN